jgi:hypothetical protein
VVEGEVFDRVSRQDAHGVEYVSCVYPTEWGRANIIEPKVHADTSSRICASTPDEIEMLQGDRDLSQSTRISLKYLLVMYDCPDFIVVRVSTHPERDKSSTASISSPRTTQGRYSVPRLTKTDMLIPPTPKMYFAKYLLYTLWYIPPGGIHLISASKRGGMRLLGNLSGKVILSDGAGGVKKYFVRYANSWEGVRGTGGGSFLPTKHLQHGVI